MVIDREEYKRFLLQLIASGSFPGEYLDIAYAVKKAVEQAEVPTEKDND